MTHDQDEFVTAVFALCSRNYEAGGGEVVECFTSDDVLAQFNTLEEVKKYCLLRVEQAKNYRWGEDDDPEVNRPAWVD